MRHSLMQHQQVLGELSEGVIYMMGLSFLLGSLFTIFVLVVFDFMRRQNLEKK